MRTMYISPNYKEDDFVYPLTLESKIEIFRDRVDGWQLSIADQCINGGAVDAGKPTPPIGHSGFAVMHIVMSYFEMIAKYESGFAGERQSHRHFKLGFASVFPQLPDPSSDKMIKKLVTALYDGVRNGLYHCAITSRSIVLSGGPQEPITVDRNKGWLIINPHLLVPHLQRHLADYVHRLRDPVNIGLRGRFLARWEWQHAQDFVL